jgi:MFS family permease
VYATPKKRRYTIMAKKKTGKRITFKDRKTGLIIFGIFHIIIGAFCVLFMLSTIIGAMALRNLGETTTAAMSVGQMILFVSLYPLLAVWFVWMGIGSILARKWARALILITSWLWLICGIIGLIAILLFMPDIFGPLTTGEEIPREAAVIVQTIVTAFLAFILIVVPGAFVLFYGSRHVKATCEQRDPQARWIDKAPLPVIALSSIWGCIAISMPLTGLYRWTTHFFGLVLSGIPGAIIVLIYALLFAYAAWGTYKLQVKAWWCGFLATAASNVSIVLTFSRVSQGEFYEKMGLPQERLEIIQRLDLFHDLRVLILGGLAIIGYLVFIIYTKRYFKASAR